jgi:ABC-2 type transport system permease protein
MTVVDLRIRREVQRCLRSAKAWSVVALFAVGSGWAFLRHLERFLDASVQALSSPPIEPVNVNQWLIRPYLLDVGLVALVLLPLLTARAYRREPPAAEADADSPAPGALATFAGVWAVYKVMLLTSALLVAWLFRFGAPEWRPIVSGYVGLLLMGAAFVAVALFIASLASNAYAAAVATWTLSFALATTAWLAWTGEPTVRAALRHASVGEMLNDFARGVVDSGYAVACLAVAAVALVLTRLVTLPERPGH